jgi:hypothetical protein
MKPSTFPREGQSVFERHIKAVGTLFLVLFASYQLTDWPPLKGVRILRYRR